MDEQLRREIVFTPAFDERNPDSSKNYGIHGVDIRFHLIGEQGATQFVIYTNWQLPEVTKEQNARPIDRRFPHLSCHPMPADLGFHRLTRSADWQTKREDCNLLGGRPCYGDGSGMMAQDLFNEMLREGDAAVWRKLEWAYRRWILEESEDEEATN